MSTPHRCFVAAVALALAAAVLSSCAPPPTYELGQLTLQPGGDPQCPAGSTCRPFTVACPELSADGQGVLSVGEPTPGVTRRGTIAFFSGGGGGEWWSHGGGANLLPVLHEDGYRTVEVRWQEPWLDASAGERAGTARVACRPATAIAWIHDHLYSATGTAAGVGHCGFCVTGNSGGATQVTYSLELYGLESILDAVVPTSGPPHAAEAKGCLDQPGYAYITLDNRRHIDSAWGYLRDDGPCVAHGQGFDFGDQWRLNSVETAGTDYVHPDTRVQFIFGGQDRTNSPQHARDYEAALVDHGSPIVSEVVVPNMGHGIGSPDGLAALQAALEA